MIIITAYLRIQHKRPEREKQDWATERCSIRSIVYLLQELCINNCALRPALYLHLCMAKSTPLVPLVRCTFPHAITAHRNGGRHESDKLAKLQFPVSIVSVVPMSTGNTWNRYPKACAMVAHLILAASNLCKLDFIWAVL